VIDPAIVAAQASRVNLTPSVIWAIGQQKNAFGNDQFANEIAARKIANELAVHVAERGSIEKALSVMQTGDPNAYQSPTHPASGYVAGVLGLAGSQAAYGMDHFSPASPESFSEHVADVHGVFSNLAELGGVVTHEGVAALAHAVQQHVPETGHPDVSAPSPQNKTPIIPSGPKPQDVAEFQQHASALGIDPEHFIQNFPFAASMNRKLTGKAMGLEDFAPMALMDRSQMQQHLRAQPHPTYPEITVGQYHDAYAQASLQSWKAGYMPHASEAANFAALGHDPKQIAAYYQDQADAKAKKEGKVSPGNTQESTRDQAKAPDNQAKATGNSTITAAKPTVIQGGQSG
jgi:hypothetical protein